MIYVNEWLPNPVGRDTTGEFVELYNNGSGVVSLSGWRLGTGTASTSAASGIVPAKTKPLSLNGFTVNPRGYLILTKANSKISLKNTDGALLLYGPGGNVADGASFEGSAPAGKSYSRTDYRISSAQHFAFTYPTPGAPNAGFNAGITINRYPLHTVLNPSSPFAMIVWQGIGFAVMLAFTIFYGFKKNENLSRFLFGGNEAIRGDARAGSARA